MLKMSTISWYTQECTVTIQSNWEKQNWNNTYRKLKTWRHVRLALSDTKKQIDSKGPTMSAWGALSPASVASPSESTAGTAALLGPWLLAAVGVVPPIWLLSPLAQILICLIHHCFLPLLEAPVFIDWRVKFACLCCNKSDISENNLLQGSGQSC